MQQILYKINDCTLLLEVMYTPYPKRDLYNILPLLKVFLKLIYTLYSFYNTLSKH